MRVTPCVRFALILAVLFTRTVSVHPSGMTEEAKEDAEQPAATPAASPLVSIVKDTKNVRTQGFLLHHDLDDITGCRDAYLQARTEWLEFFGLLRILDPPWRIFHGSVHRRTGILKTVR